MAWPHNELMTWCLLAEAHSTNSMVKQKESAAWHEKLCRAQSGWYGHRGNRGHVGGVIWKTPGVQGITQNIIKIGFLLTFLLFEKLRLTKKKSTIQIICNSINTHNAHIVLGMCNIPLHRLSFHGIQKMCTFLATQLTREDLSKHVTAYVNRTMTISSKHTSSV
jgi:hypothetical protein